MSSQATIIRLQEEIKERQEELCSIHESEIQSALTTEEIKCIRVAGLGMWERYGMRCYGRVPQQQLEMIFIGEDWELEVVLVHRWHSDNERYDDTIFDLVLPGIPDKSYSVSDNAWFQPKMDPEKQLPSTKEFFQRQRDELFNAIRTGYGSSAGIIEKCIALIEKNLDKLNFKF